MTVEPREIQSPKAVFFDRDGTLLKHVHYLHRPEEAELLPGVAAAIQSVVDRGVKLFLFTNQSGVGQKLFKLADVEAVNRRMLELLGRGYDLFTDTCIATEHPAAEPAYRKPSPRFIHEALARHGISPHTAVMVGDNPSDWQAGINAGIRSVAVRSHLLDAAAEQFRRDAGIALYDSVAHWISIEWPE